MVFLQFFFHLVNYYFQTKKWSKNEARNFLLKKKFLKKDKLMKRNTFLFKYYKVRNILNVCNVRNRHKVNVYE